SRVSPRVFDRHTQTNHQQVPVSKPSSTLSDLPIDTDGKRRRLIRESVSISPLFITLFCAEWRPVSASINNTARVGNPNNGPNHNSNPNQGPNYGPNPNHGPNHNPNPNHGPNYGPNHNPKPNLRPNPNPDPKMMFRN
ncbi:hypothetical protein GBF38_001349, partial [Nibea albiflora]